MKFNELLKEERKNRKLSQEKLAELIGVSKSTIYNWEAKRNLPSLKDPCLLELVNLFDISIDYLKKIIALSEKSEDIEFCTYDFLPDLLIDFKLDVYEVKLLKLFYIQKNLISSIPKNVSDQISILDIINYLGNEQIAINTINSFTKKSENLFFNKIQDIILNEELEEFDIKNISFKNIIHILSFYDGLIELLYNYKKDNVYITKNRDYIILDYKKEPDRPLFNEFSGVPSSDFYKTKMSIDYKDCFLPDLFTNKYDFKRNSDNELYGHLDEKTFIIPFIHLDDNPYTEIVSEVIEEDRKRFELEVDKYNKNIELYKELEKQGHENVIDLKKIKYPEEITCFFKVVLTDKGERLLDFLSKNKTMKGN